MVTQQIGFADFVRAHTAALIRTAYLLTGDPVAAEELVQDTLVGLYPKWQRVAAADMPLAYVRRSLSNRFLNERRRPASRDLLTAVPPERPDGADPYTAFGDRELLWGLLHTLPDRQRAALVLRFFDDLDDGAIAEALDCRPGTVRSLISRGLATLRERVTDDETPTRGGDR